jgi:membrane protein YqaA with SNARE-associated domain
MNLVDWVLEYGVWGVAAVAFIGATVVPISSEVAVVAALKLGIPPWQVLLSASVGNSLGASLNFGLGWLFGAHIHAKLLQSRGGRQALRWTERYGKWGLFGSWLPVLGDPLCLAAGLFRVSPAFFAIVGLGTRVVRYVIIVYMLAM